MRNELERLAVEYGLPTCMSFLAAVLRLMFTQPRESFWGAVRTIFVALVAGNFVAKLVVEFQPNWSPTVVNSITILAAISASDLLPALLKWLRSVKDNPEELGNTLSRIVPFIGRKR